MNWYMLGLYGVVAWGALVLHAGISALRDDGPRPVETTIEVSKDAIE
jgi:hypothetical protein